MFERAGFWRRAVALSIDIFVVGIALQIIAAVLYPLSEGRIQFAGSGIQTRSCRVLSSLPPGIPAPATFTANFAETCVFSFFGFPTAHTTIVGRRTQDGPVTKTESVTFMIDDKGEPANGLPLDLLFLPILLLLRWRADRHGGSPGRRACGMRVVSAVTGSTIDPAFSGAVARRYGLFAAPFIPVWLLVSYAWFFPGAGLVDSSAFIPALITLGVLGDIPALWAVIAIIGRQDAFYDRAAHTMVRRIVSKKPEP